MSESVNNSISETEIWKPVKNWESKYTVSNLGRLKNIKTGKLIKGCKNSRGYLNVSLSDKPQKCITVHIHVLVAETFIGPRPKKLEVNHKDGNKENNRVDNLEYVSHSRNQKHAFSIGLNRQERGEKNPMAKLTPEKVKAIREYLSQGLSLSQISLRFSISISAIAAIKQKRTWTHV